MTRDAALKPLKVFFSVGEPSGDALAARLMSGIISRTNGRTVEFYGVGGPLMEEQGLKSLFPMDDLTVMGLTEVLPKIPLLLKRIGETAAAAQEINPDIFISVDAPDFSFRVAKRLKEVPFPKVHYVAPSVWAWRSGRAAKIAKIYDHLLTLLPFEPQYFEKEGLSATFVGHSVVETGADHGDGIGFRQKHGLDETVNLLMVLPGSRRGEVGRHLPIFKEAIENLVKEVSNLTVVIPVIGKTQEMVEADVKNWPVKVILTTNQTEKYDAMAAANVALAASGTVGLELALADLPAVISYKMHAITSYIARKVVKLDYVNLINIIEDREIVPEHILENCKPDILSRALTELFKSPEAQMRQIEGCRRAVKSLRADGEAPGDKAAGVILSLIKSGK